MPLLSRLRRALAPDAFTLRGRELRLDPARLIGAGGEAEIFDIGNDVAAKRFKQPDHPDFALSPAAQQAAAARLAEHQQKIPALMRLMLPARVAAPLDVIEDAAGAIAGYTMPVIRDAEVLLRYGDRPYREQGGVTMALIAALLLDLHRTVTELHARGIVIGDFNDLNVLVKGTECRFIDIDSAQFGGFVSHVFTVHFLDPRLTGGQTPAPVRPHDEDSDWFAFAVMAFRLLLLVHPYGGIHRPAAGAVRVAQEARPLERMSVFHAEVNVPKQALPFEALPDPLLQHFQATFDRDRRGAFPVTLLSALQWRRCRCGTEFAADRCPRCTTAAPRVARPMQVVRGRVTAEEVFATAGVLVAVAVDEDRVLWLEHRDGSFRREDGSVVFRGPLDPRLTFALQCRATIVTRGDETLTFRQGGVERQRVSTMAVNARHRYWIDGDTLYRDGPFAAEPLGSIVGGLTRLWMGETFGFGFYRVGELTVAFVVDAERRGIRDGVPLPRLAGQLIDAGAAFGDDRCWLFTATQEGGAVRHRCTVIRRDGSIETGTQEEAPKDGTWLSRIHGNAAAAGYLLAATDEGIVRVEPGAGGPAVRATFPDSEPFVDGTTRLFVTAGGVLAVSASRIDVLRMTP